MTAAPEQLMTVVADLRRFLLPLIEDENEGARWKPRAGWILDAAAQEI
jgi:hypothetical protein